MKTKIYISIIFTLIFIKATCLSFGQVTFNVTKTTDPDPYLYTQNPDDPEIVGTLQWAIRKANAATVNSTININIPGTGYQTIKLNYYLPPLKKKISISGGTQPGTTETDPKVIIDGDNKISKCFVANFSCQIKNLRIQNFLDCGIFLDGATNCSLSSLVINNINNGSSEVATAGIHLNKSIANMKGIILGTDNVLSPGLGIENYGFLLTGSSTGTLNTLTNPNIIAYCGTAGICIQQYVIFNLGRTIFVNNTKAISFPDGAPLPKPVITSYSITGKITGTAFPGSSIILYGSTGNQNANYLPLFNITANANGNWDANFSDDNWPYVTAYATYGNTFSELSDAVSKIPITIPGATCTAAVPLPPATYTCSGTELQMTDSVFWMGFTADTSSMRIAIKYTSSTSVSIQKLILYTGDCGTLQEIAKKDKNLGDQLDIVKTDLVVGETYLAKAVQNGSGDGAFSICIAKSNPDPCVANPIVLDINETDSIITGQSVQIGTDPVIGYTYNWTPSTGLNDPNIANPLASPDNSITYNFTIQNPNGCSLSKTVTVYVSNNGLCPDCTEGGMVVQAGENNNRLLFTGCGLNFTVGSVVLQTRYSAIAHETMPGADIQIGQVPYGAKIIGAYLWWVVERTSSAATPLPYYITTPDNVSHGIYSYTLTGNNSFGNYWSIYIPDLDYRFGTGASGYRADITSFLPQNNDDGNHPVNGSYKLDGFPTADGNVLAQDVDGATLIIIYEEQPGNNYKGTLIIDEGLISNFYDITASSNTISIDMDGLNIPGSNVVNERTFMQLADFQGVNCISSPYYNINSSGNNIFNAHMWDFIEKQTVLEGQTSVNFRATVLPCNGDPLDAVTVQFNGVYYQEESQFNVGLTATQTVFCEGDNICPTIFANVTGGIIPFTYQWSTGATTSQIDVCPTFTTVYTVTVTDNCQNIVIKDITITVNPNPTLTLTGTPVCTDQQTTLTANASNGTTPYDFTWSTGATSVNNPNSITGYPAVYGVTVTDANGCTDSESMNIIGYDSPTASITGSTDICGEQPVIFTACCNAQNYSWFTNGTFIGDGSNFTVTPPLGTTTYTVSAANTYYIAEIDDWLECLATDQHTITVNPAITVDLQQMPSGCPTVSLKALPESGLNYSWNIVAEDGTQMPFPNNTPDFNGSINQPTTFSITATDPGTQCTATDMLIVYPLTADAGSDVSRCANDQASQLNAVTCTGCTYLWYPPAGLSATDIPDPFASPASSVNYFLQVTDANGVYCYDYVTVNVNPLPVINLGDDLNVCKGNETTITAHGGGTYQWNTGETTATVTFNQSQSAAYSVTVTSTQGCTASEEINVNVMPLPTVQLSNTSICPGGDGVLTAITGGIPVANYSWSNGTSGSNASSITVSTNGYFDVMVTGTNGCTANTTAYVSFKHLPSVQVNNDILCSGGNATLHASTTGTMVPVVSYSWSNGTNGSNATDITVNALGTYHVTVTGDNGCIASNFGEVQNAPVLMLPQISVQNNQCLAKDGSTATFLPAPVAGSGITQSWDYGDGTVTDLNTHNFPNSYGYHTIKLTLTNQCDATISACIPVFVNPDDCVCGLYFDVTTDMNVTTNNPPHFFDAPHYINSTIKIPTGSNVTITKDQVFGPMGRIIVEKGATLTINALKKLTTYPDCEYMWQGIEVLGTPTANSYSATNPSQTNPAQGKLILGHETLIEHAHIGVLLGGRAPYMCIMPKPFTNTAGGIIQADGTWFFNNGIDVKFLAKSNVENSKSFFTACDFICNQLLADVYYSKLNPSRYPNIHNPWAGFANPHQRTTVGIDMEKIANPLIENNNFYNTEFGIKSLNAKYNVTGTGTSFSKHLYGIYIDNSMTTPYSHMINGPTFDNIPPVTYANKNAAIYINAGSGDVIKSCNFGLTNSVQSDNIMGISLQNTSGFIIFDNKFKNFTTGIRVYNSGTGGGDIGPFNPTPGAPSLLQQRNIFTKCKTGVTTNATNSGLLIYCNDFDNSALLVPDYFKCIYNTGTLVDQSPSGKPIGDKFSYPPGIFMNHVHSNTIPFNYNWNGNATDYLPTVNSNVLPNYVSISPKCNSTWYNPSATVTNLQVLAQLKSSLAQLQQNLSTLQANLDHGNTQTLLQAVNSNMPHGQLKNTLLANSPLSDTVLHSVIKRPNALAPGIFKDVMMPNLPVSRELVTDFMAKLATLPNGIANQLRAAYFNNPDITTGTKIQREIEQLQYERNMLLAYTINQYLDSGAVDSVILLLESEGTAEAKQKLVSLYMDEENLALAQTRLAEIQALNQDLTDWKNLFDILLSLANAGKTLQNLDSLQLAFISELAYKCPANLAVSNAQGILSFLYGTVFPYCEDGSSSYTLMSHFIPFEIQMPESTPAAGEKMEYLGENYPNPFDGSTSIPYYLNEGRAGLLKIYNDKGTLMKTLKVSDGERVINIETGSWRNGVYFYTLEVDKVSLGWNKMVLIK